jgi:hypothetical protein
MTISLTLWRRSVLAGLAAVMLAGSFVLAATRPEHSAAAPRVNGSVTVPGRPDVGCSASTNSIKQLAMIDNTSEGGFQCLGVSVEGGTVKAVRLERHGLTSAAGQPVSAQVRIVEFPAATVDSIHGATLDGIPGHDAIILRGHFSRSPGKTELMMSYLFNGVTGEFHSCPVTIDSTPETGWRLINRYDQTISHIVVKIRQAPMIGVIGIDDLEGACTPGDR